MLVYSMFCVVVCVWLCLVLALSMLSVSVLLHLVFCGVDVLSRF